MPVGHKTIQELPPKMAAQYAKLASEGKADKNEAGFYVFVKGRIETIITSIDPPEGYIMRK